MQSTAWLGHLIKVDRYQSSKIENRHDTAKEGTNVPLAESVWNFLVRILFDGSISA